jgi:hypothetical protein
MALLAQLFLPIFVERPHQLIADIIMAAPVQANVEYLPDVKQLFMMQRAAFNNFFEKLDMDDVSKLAHKVGGILLRRVLCAHAETTRVRCDCTGGDVCGHVAWRRRAVRRLSNGVR